MSRLKQLISEIHRRSIWQVLAIYLIGAWLAFEIIQTLTEGLGLPGWFPAFALVLFIVGLPIVLATAIVRVWRIRCISCRSLLAWSSNDI